MNAKRYNILFIYSNIINPIRGGIESVTYELAKYFSSKGYLCYYLSLNNTTNNDNKQFYFPDSSHFFSERNKDFLINFIKENNINILINQGGFDKECCLLAYEVKKYGVKLISCIHNSLLDRIRNFEVSYYSQFKERNMHYFLKCTRYSFIKKMLYSMYRFKYQKHFKRLHECSDLVILLSDSFKQDLSFFIGDLSHKVCSMPNPIPTKIYETESNTQKDKIILFVGRMDMQQKKLDLLLQIWSMIYRNHREWKLVIVGGGKDLNLVKEYASSLQLENVLFEGFQDPIPYYKKASVFCMTSAHEGFGIVLIEAMNMKVVPIAFDSFSTIRDIIDDKINGILIPPFDKDLYAKKLSEMMRNDDLRYNLSNNSYQKSLQFRMEVIGNKWLTLFASLYDDTIVG